MSYPTILFAAVLIFTTLVTVVHTIDEVQGKIWDALDIPPISYALFQFAILLLGFDAVINGKYVWLYIAVRLLDLVVTHLIFRKPGVKTAPLLAIDAGVLILWNALNVNV